MSYLRYLCLFGSSLPPVYCRRAHVLFRMFGSSLPPVIVGGRMSYLSYLCLFGNSGVQHILCCVFVSFRRLVLPVLPVFLDCHFLDWPFGIV
jgi:hypothetical protein